MVSLFLASLKKDKSFFNNLNNFSQEPGIDANKEKNSSPASQILLFDNDKNEVRMEEYSSIVNKEENERILDDENKSIMEEKESMEEENKINIEESKENVNMKENESELSKYSEKSVSSIGDIEDFQSGSLSAAIDDINNAAGDAILRILQKHYNEQLPTSTQKGRVYINMMDIKGLNLKIQDLVEFEGRIYKLYYRSIIDAIKSFTSNQELYETLMRVYSKQNIAEWWCERESPFSKVLAVILYVDGTTLDAYG
ncbi:hypothetical protein C1646_772558 [Rhizophagus diaphanus]|nr:hypothetical protein C1646_772558 [Rhizophagus diaphanus] [Rhizophagus sp. MUCL 43196]